ncbi:hypothetical protein BGW36DRAFT_466680 [Talaromyces proteolyticus]|uniref:NACHT domain-containing protein n=1 Tax=Talaromyces proteolyticus TaxID=1131652 RepID=A0AAD4PUC0_9EURO|nr:uncharacterized protein BGW36DRAFT_466680 [Talaromyces proteolyticus]KAH8689133.1 hypothetical protein BGW36DRAFT_466680 [Talaromyces proteolyticus]
MYSRPTMSPLIPFQLTKIDKAALRHEPDLWLKALENLPVDDRKEFDVCGVGRLQILEETLGSVNELKRTSVDRRWGIRYHQRTIVLSEVFDKIAFWIKKFKEVGDVATQFDQTHASLPWAGIRFILQVALNNYETIASMAEGVELVANLIVRYSIYEVLYLNKDSTIGKSLKAAITKVYANILTYLLKAKRYYRQSAMKRFTLSVIETGGDTILGLIKNIFDADQCVKDFINVIQVEGTEDLRQAVNEVHSRLDIVRHDVLERFDSIFSVPRTPITECRHSISDVEHKVKEVGLAEVAKWLSGVPYKTHHQIENRRRLAGTCSWIQYNRNFKSWIQSTSSTMLWLHGILSYLITLTLYQSFGLDFSAGSGKTIVISSVIDSLETAYPDSNSSAPVCYFYCQKNNAEKERSHPEEILRSIASQLIISEDNMRVRNTAQGPILSRITAIGKDEVQAFPIDETTKLILEVIERKNTVFIIVDAIDEVDPLRRHELLLALELIVRQSSRPVRVLVSSRNDGDITSHLENTPNVYISEVDNQDDIRNFVCHSVDKIIEEKRLIRGRVSNELKNRIMDKLIEKGKGMFRWVSLQLESMCDCRRVKVEEDIEYQLHSLPMTLKDSYDIIYQNIAMMQFRSRVIAERTLKWLFCCQRTLISQELISLVTFDFPRQPVVDEILDVCCNLVVLDQQLDIFRFAHLSVREYLESRPEYSPTSVHSLALETCLKYLVRTMDRGRCQYCDRDTTVWPYVSIYWPIHAELTENHRPPDLQDCLLHFILDESEESAFCLWLSECDQISFTAPFDVNKRLRTVFNFENSPVHVSCTYGLTTVAESLLMCGKFHWDQKNYRGDTPLALLLMNNHSETAIKILSKASITKVTENDLVTAARFEGSDTKIMDLLLDQASLTDITERVALAAVQNRKNGREIIGSLFDRRKDLVISKGFFKEAAGNAEGNAIIKFLLQTQRGLVVTSDVLKAAIQNKGQTYQVLKTLLGVIEDEKTTKELIIMATKHDCGDCSLIQLFWDRGSEDMNMLNEETLKAAMENTCGPRKVLEWLWQKREDFSITEEIIIVAVRNWEHGLDLVQFLWDKMGGFRVTQQILKTAAWNWKSGENIIRFLSMGQELPVSKDVVLTAVRHGTKDIVDLLLNHLQFHCIDEDVIRGAAQNELSGPEIIKLLWERQDTCPVTDYVLRGAVGNFGRGMEILQLLLTKESDVVITEQTMIEAASNEEFGHSMVGFILNKTDKSIVSKAILEAAATAGQEKVLQLLRNRCENCDMDYLMRIARFFNAAKTGDLIEVQTLLSKGVPPDMRNIRGVTPLWRAASLGNHAVVKLLLDNTNVDPNARSIGNRGPIFWASENGFSDIVKMLLEHGADPNVIDNHGRTAYSVAKEGNHSGVQKVLEEFESLLR